MANSENLTKYKIRTTDEAREKGRKGGIASGVARRKKKNAAELAKRIIFAEMEPRMKKGIEKLTGELSEEENTLYSAVVAAQIKEAISGNTRAAEYVQDLIDSMGGLIEDEREDDPLSKSLKELGESL